jgi:hypothetical protein
METTKENNKYEYLHKIAFRQGVKPAKSISDLYPKTTETFDVDEYLKNIKEIRKNDKERK